MKEFHDRYGSVVRIAPNELAYISAAAWKDIYGYRPDKPQNPKDLMTLPAFHEGQAVDLVRNNDVDHARVRRLISYAFSTKALEEQQPTITSYVDLLIQRLKENATEPQNMVAWYTWTTFDIVGDFIFGESFNGLQDQRWHPWVATLNEGLETAIIFNVVRRYISQSLVMKFIPRKKREEFDQLAVYVKEKVAARLQRGTDRPDLISYVTQNDKEGNQMSQGELEANAEVFVAAGSETTASLLSGLTYYLCTNPHILGKVTAEIRNAFNEDCKMTFRSISKLEYLSATINEGLRGKKNRCFYLE